MNNRKIRKSVIAIAVVLIVGLGAAAVYAFNRKTGKPVSSSKTALSQTSASQVPSKASSKQGGSKTSADSSSNSETGSLLMLVNKDNKLPEDYSPSFTEVPSKYYSSSDKDNRFDSRAASYLEKMMDSARKAGYSLNIISGYRTYAYQQSNFDRHVKALTAKGESLSQAQADAALSVAPPGTSEHQTGLAADIITSDWYNKNSELTADFDKTAAFKWLYSNCAEYGFILRYPKDKQSITKYEYEPWHYRFVGVTDAKKIMSSGLCLEEYTKK
ncbi:MAG TPA: M15 family metallopeptidase [Ruminiclostridium sp.]|nr:M15 family metallopeptidase [Ruminiclostridium sp.]